MTSRQHTPSRSVAERDALLHGGMRASAPLANRYGANSPGKEVRALVLWAVQARKRALTYQWSRLDHATVTAHLDLLIDWLRVNPAPSASTIKAFNDTLGMSLRYVMPTNAAGKDKLQQYERLLFTL
jgi:hypothetical protein